MHENGFAFSGMKFPGLFSRMLSFMTQMQQKNLAQDLFPFSGTEDLSVMLSEERSLIIEKSKNGVMELPVNNYLKTPDEIELEFRYGINPRRLNLRKDNLSNVTSTMQKDGYLNIHNLDEALSGFMEENY